MLTDINTRLNFLTIFGALIMVRNSPHQIDLHVGNRLRTRRLVLGMSQEKLGGRLGITFQQIQKYEKGTNRVSASKLLAAAGVLSVPVSYFFEDQASESDGITREVDEIGAFLLSREGVALNRAFAQIRDPLVRRKVVALAKVLAGHDADPLHNAESINTAKPELRT